MSILSDTNEGNITVKEYEALSLILRSERCGILTRNLCDAISMMDDEGSSFLVSLIPGIVQRMASRANGRVSSMKNFMYMLGRSLSSDRVTSGSRKGKPAFLTAEFAKKMECGAWAALAFVHDFANFMESARKVAADPDQWMQMTAKSVGAMDELAGSYIARFRQFIDDMEVKPLSELVSSTIFNVYPDMMELLEWCRDNRKVWDDLEAEHERT